MCFNKLLSNYKKPVCKECLDSLLKEEKYSFMEEMRSFIKGEVQTSVAASVASIIPQIVPPKRPRVMESYSESEAESEEASTSFSLDMDVSQSIAATKMESKYLFASENLDALLKAVRDTLKIEDIEEAKSVQDELFGILKAKKKRVFPINNTLKELILEEWREPENRISVSKDFKNRLIFDEEEVKNWNATPKVDVQVTKITKKTDLPFEDAIQLRDPMDRKADSLLKKAWEAAMLNLKVNIATTSVSRTLFFWLSELENHIKTGTSREMLLDTIPMLKSATAFIADASAEGVRFSAKESALSNSVRRAIWLRQWSGDCRSKAKLCSLPFQGEYVFGAELDAILERAADRKKGFPETRTGQRKQSFRDPKEKKFPYRGKGKQGRWSYSKGGRGRGFLLSSSNSSSNFRKQ
ncbi:hypothetical protein GDO81_013062 [Engystomops pustulosus]|uniref:Lamina-associated polypeptide 2 alpha C-terminal domain-containing protein n=2 Tax=Engystomops pustulosus TaxID=76066 RepID=A0AAV7AWN9_ENGPU|nr:hypothetical protein GDO81_013062 [Engystomops pustulosus]